MKVKDLIEKLNECDPDAPVWTIDSCGCCTTFVEVEPSQSGEPYLDDLRRWVDTIPVRAASHAWAERVVLIAGGMWSRYPGPDDDAHAGH